VGWLNKKYATSVLPLYHYIVLKISQKG